MYSYTDLQATSLLSQNSTLSPSLDYNFVLTRFGRQHLLMKLFDEAAEHALINFEFLAILQSVSIQHQLGLDIFALLGLALKYG